MGKPTVSEAIKAIKANDGFVNRAARACGTSRTTFHKMINDHPTLKEAVDDAREEKLDQAEGKLLEQINDGNTTAIIFYLKTQGKNRGYTERHEHSGPDGGPIETRRDDLSDEERAIRLAAILDRARERRGGPAADGPGGDGSATAEGGDTGGERGG